MFGDIVRYNTQNNFNVGRRNREIIEQCNQFFNLSVFVNLSL
jgi:hypothetical protein